MMIMDNHTMIIMNTMINVDHSLPPHNDYYEDGTITVITMITNNHVIIKNIETHVVNAEKNVNKEKPMKQSTNMNLNNMTLI